MKIDALTLLERWQRGHLDDGGTAHLLQCLQDPQRAAALVDDARLVYALRELHRQQSARQRRRQERRQYGMALAALLMLGVFASWWWFRPSAAGWIVRGADHVLVHRGHAEPAPLHEGDAVRSGDRVIVADDGRATLATEDGQAVHLAASTQMAIGVSADRVELIAGRLAAEVTARVPAQPFIVTTALATIEVLGTRFTVEEQADHTRVQVASGMVRVERRSDGASLILRPGGRTTVRASGDLIDASLTATGPAWPDRRPLALVRLWQASDQPGNPHSFAHVPPGTDVTTPAGQQIFAAALAAGGRDLGQRLSAAGYQGAIVWDIEGRQADELMYTGDPRRLADLAPEMAAAADGFFAGLRAAGLHTGVLLRPERLQRDANAPSGWRQRADVDHHAELLAKMRWVQERWHCSLFFINTDALPVRTDGRRLAPGILSQLAAAFPDSLLLAEHAQDEDWGAVAGWQLLSATGAPALPQAWRTRYPDGMRVLLWQAADDPPARDPAHDVLMREITP